MALIDEIHARQEKIKKLSNDELLEKREELMDLLTSYGNKWDELQELLEIERQLTLREEV